MNVVILCSHPPDPRMNKRISSLSKISSQISVVYWKRNFANNFDFCQVDGITNVGFEVGEESFLFSRLINNMKLVKKSVKAISGIRPTLLYVDGIECMAVAKKLRKRFNFFTILEIADLPAMSHIERMGPFARLLENLVIQEVSSADAIVVTSPYYYYDYYRSRTSIGEDDVFVFENVPKRAIFKSFNRREHDSFRVAFIGSIRYFDSLKTLFEAVKKTEGLEVVISGRGPDYHRIMEQSKEYPNVKVTGGYNYEEEIAALYSDVDLVYSVYDTKRLNVRLALPNRLYEAIVCGIPIVVAKGTCLERYVNELGVGYSVEYRNVEELRSLLMHLKTFPKAMQEISNRESMIAERFFYENREKEFLNWISRLI